MQREWIVIGAVVLVVLVPMWAVALHGEPPSQEIGIDQSVSEMRPLAGPIDAPNKLTPSQVGVVVWIALGGLLGALTVVHRFMNDAVRPAGAAEAGPPDGVADWLRAGSRQIVAYHPPSMETHGIVVMGGLTVVAIVCAALFTGEYLTLARTQYFGLYAAGMFFSLALATVAYYAWFLPHVTVAEPRDHS